MIIMYVYGSNYSATIARTQNVGSHTHKVHMHTHNTMKGNRLTIIHNNNNMMRPAKILEAACYIVARSISLCCNRY